MMLDAMKDELTHAKDLVVELETRLLLLKNACARFLKERDVTKAQELNLNDADSVAMHVASRGQAEEEAEQEMRNAMKELQP